MKGQVTESDERFREFDDQFSLGATRASLTAV